MSGASNIADCLAWVEEPQSRTPALLECTACGHLSRAAQRLRGFVHRQFRDLFVRSTAGARERRRPLPRL